VLADALLIKGVPVGRVSEVPTPLNPPEAPRMLFGFQAVSLAMVGLLGTPFAYRTQQLGRLVNNIAPLSRALDVANVGIGSGRPFDLHTEDAFMPRGPSYIMLACVRNPGCVPTTVSGLNEKDKGDWTTILRQPRYIVPTNPGQSGWSDRAGFAGPIVWGREDRPFLRYNAINTRPSPGNDMTIHYRALDTLRKVLERNLEDLDHREGDIAIINNYRLCHARRAFPVRFDGTDRWLLRVVAYRDPADVADFTTYEDYPILEPMGTQ
jgi:hypothetical protein